MRRISTDNSKRFFDLPVAKVLKNHVNEWEKIVRDCNKNKRVAKHKIDIDWSEFTQENYIFTHNTIVSSVATEDDYFSIIDPCHELVNANGNAWSNYVLPYCYKTFVGKPVYQEHIEIPCLSKGLILDAVLRPVDYIGTNGKKAQVFYVDLLCATERKHSKLVDEILDGKMNSMSMGITVDISQCSVCGKKIKDDNDFCDHLKNHQGEWVYDKKSGKNKFCAELIGVVDEKGNFVESSCEFIESSWVDDPAFIGAVLNYFIESPDMEKLRKSDMRYFDGYIDLDYLNKLKVADKSGKIIINVLCKLIKQAKFNQIKKAVFKKLK